MCSSVVMKDDVIALLKKATLPIEIPAYIDREAEFSDGVYATTIEERPL